MKRGFTLLEVLLAMVIFAASVLAITQTVTGGLRNARESERVFEATQAAQSKMAELQMKYQAKIDKDGVEGSLGEEEGSFPKPFERYKWKAALAESNIKFTRATVEKFLGQVGLEEREAADKAEELRLVLANLNKVFKENFVELKLTVSWQEYGKKYSVPVVTHLLPTKPKIELTATGEE